MGQLLRGNLGESIIHHTQVTFDLTYRLPATMEMVLLSHADWGGIGVTVGVVSRSKRNSIFDVVGMIGALLGVSMPIFWLALILIYALAVNAKILPPSGRIDATNLCRPAHRLYPARIRCYPGISCVYSTRVWHLILPADGPEHRDHAALWHDHPGLLCWTCSTRTTCARPAPKVSKKVWWLKACPKNALLPVITVIGGQLGGLLGGAILTETIFSWPGMGTWTYQAILSRDYPIVQGGVLVSATIFVFVNLVWTFSMRCSIRASVIRELIVLLVKCSKEKEICDCH